MRRIKVAILLLITGLVFTMVGCSDSRYDVVKKTLEDKYGEEMLVYSVEALGIKYEAKCAPVNNPEVVFETRMLTDGTEEWDDYYQRYTAKLMNDILKEDLKQFFPDAYIRTKATLRMVDETMDFREHTLVEIMANSISEGPTSGAFVYIYINKESGTTQEYEKEYQYFTETVDQYISEGKMIPITVSFYWLDNEIKNKVENYYSRDLRNNDYLETEVLCVNSHILGIMSEDDTDLGNPPNISACFDNEASGYIGSKEEYIRRREILENGSGR